MKELSLSIGGSPIPLPGGISSQGNLVAQNFVTFGVNLLIVFAIILTLLFLIWGGFDMIMANGEKERVTKARLKLTYAAIGLIVVFLSFLIVGTIGYLFNIKLLAPIG